MRLVQTRPDLGQKIRAGAGSGGLFDRLHPLAQIRHAGALTLFDVVQPPRQGADGLFDLAEAFLNLRTGVPFEGAQTAVPLAQLLGDVVNAPGLPFGLGVMTVQAAHQAGDGLIDPLDGDGRTALGRLQPGGQGVDRGADPLPFLVRRLIGVVQTAGAMAAVIGVGDRTAARKRGVALFLVVHDHGVQPLAQGHA